MKLVTRGQLHNIVTGVVRDRDLSLDYRGTRLLQDLAGEFSKLPGRWMDGGMKQDIIRLDTDMVSVEDVKDVLKQADGRDTELCGAISEIRDAVDGAGCEAR